MNPCLSLSTLTLVAALFFCSVPQGFTAEQVAIAPQSLSLFNAHNGQTLTIQLFDDQGKLNRSALKKINRFMACRRTRSRRTIAPELIVQVHKLSQEFGGSQVILYSGFRHRRVSRLPGSFHIKGKAIDLALAGVTSIQLRDHLLKNYPGSGVGYYPYRPFIHFDVRGNRAFWVDESGPGEAGHYVSDPYAYLLAEREGTLPAKASLAAIIRPSTLPGPVGPLPSLADVRVLALIE